MHSFIGQDMSCAGFNHLVWTHLTKAQFNSQWVYELVGAILLFDSVWATVISVKNDVSLL